MRIQIGDTFRVSRAPGARASEYPDYTVLTRGRHSTGSDLNKGIWAYHPVSDLAGVRRVPAIILLSKQVGPASELNPWLDVIEPDDGYAFYHGDNRKPGEDPFAASGNRLIRNILPLYSAPATRHLAPPILLFEQEVVDGRRKGFRRFAGFGVPRRCQLQTQAVRGSRDRFTNLGVELVLFDLEHESQWFDWAWIDQRRDASVAANATVKGAPRSWQRWVTGGEGVLDQCRRRVLQSLVLSHREQMQMPAEERRLLREIYRHYDNTKHQFEGLASFIAQRVTGDGSSRGWVTKRSGDGGIDFVSRLSVGAGFGHTSAVVLGQAKCVAPDSSISGRDLARVVARLRRGWIGVFVTTGSFSKSAQAELLDDDYPVLLINGRRLVTEVMQELALSGLSLEELLRREDGWYEANLQMLDPAKVTQAVLGRPSWPPPDDP